MFKLYTHKKTSKTRTVQAVSAVVAVIVLAGGGFSTYLYSRPLPALAVQTAAVAAATQPATAASAIAWPGYGQSAVGSLDHGVLATSGEQKPMPTASVAKVMTALAVLDKKPLKIGETGPMLTVNDNDVAIYNHYFALDGSLVRVQSGERISQYDALQALMLPSANNIADMLANWAFGSIQAYSQFANAYAKQHGLQNSNFSDASGFASSTVSTADDLVKLGQLALQNPVISEIMAKRSAVIPIGDTTGTVYNVNGMLGKDGINGIKTGNTDEAGGVFLVSADRQTGDKSLRLIAAVMGAPNLETAMRASLPLIDATAANFEQKTFVKAGQSFGTYTAAWQPQPAKAVATKDVSALVWKSDPTKVSAKLTNLSGPQAKGSTAGEVTVTIGDKTYSTPLSLDGAIATPSTSWRLNR